jgi:hypothetical protein
LEKHHPGKYGSSKTHGPRRHLGQVAILQLGCL